MTTGPSSCTLRCYVFSRSLAGRLVPTLGEMTSATPGVRSFAEQLTPEYFMANVSDGPRQVRWGSQPRFG